MFDRVMAWLEAKDAQALPFADNDVRVAVAALWYHMIAVDGVVTQDERNQFRASRH